jgi:hypothetical protein
MARQHPDYKDMILSRPLANTEPTNEEGVDALPKVDPDDVKQDFPEQNHASSEAREPAASPKSPQGSDCDAEDIPPANADSEHTKSALDTPESNDSSSAANTVHDGSPNIENTVPLHDDAERHEETDSGYGSHHSDDEKLQSKPSDLDSLPESPLEDIDSKPFEDHKSSSESAAAFAKMGASADKSSDVLFDAPSTDSLPGPVDRSEGKSVPDIAAPLAETPSAAQPTAQGPASTTDEVHIPEAKRDTEPCFDAEPPTGPLPPQDSRPSDDPAAATDIPVPEGSHSGAVSPGLEEQDTPINHLMADNTHSPATRIPVPEGSRPNAVSPGLEEQDTPMNHVTSDNTHLPVPEESHTDAVSPGTEQAHVPLSPSMNDLTSKNTSTHMCRTDDSSQPQPELGGQPAADGFDNSKKHLRQEMPPDFEHRLSEPPHTLTPYMIDDRDTEPPPFHPMRDPVLDSNDECDPSVTNDDVGIEPPPLHPMRHSPLNSNDDNEDNENDHSEHANPLEKLTDPLKTLHRQPAVHGLVRTFEGLKKNLEGR